MKVAELYPAPANLRAPTALALSADRRELSVVLGFSTIPTLAIWFPVIKSGFSISFSILE